MKINLSQIKPSPNPIRKSWDEAKMDELRWSLLEEGQVEPIGVHTNGAGYVIVWGHRRTEAARRAGWKEIEALIVPQDEVDNLIQAGIENLASEDMSAKDKADWAQRLIDLGLSQREISRRSSVPLTTVAGFLVYGREKEIREVFAREHPKAGDENMFKVREISEALGNDLEAKKAVAAKASEDKLTGFQTRAVAEAYRDAPTPQVRQQVLRTPVVSRDTAADILRRSMNRVQIETGAESVHEINDWQREREERRTYENFDFAVKEFLDFARLFMEVARKGTALVKYGKYSPESARFAIRKIDSLIDALKTYREELEQVK